MLAYYWLKFQSFILTLFLLENLNLSIEPLITEV